MSDGIERATTAIYREQREKTMREGAVTALVAFALTLAQVYFALLGSAAQSGVWQALAILYLLALLVRLEWRLAYAIGRLGAGKTSLSMTRASWLSDVVFTATRAPLGALIWAGLDWIGLPLWGSIPLAALLYLGPMFFGRLADRVIIRVDAMARMARDDDTDDNEED